MLQVLKDLFIKHLSNLILYENDVKLYNFREDLYRSICRSLKCEILIIDT